MGRLFRKRHGVSPTLYRELLRNKQSLGVGAKMAGSDKIKVNENPLSVRHIPIEERKPHS